MKFEVADFNKIAVGDQASITRTITETDISLFAKITGDSNPLHINEEFAKKTVFKGRIAHGMLIASWVSAVLGTKLPGFGSIYISQTLRFMKPVRIGDTITTTVEVVKKIERDPQKDPLIKLSTTCFNQKNQEVLTGEAVLIVKKK